MTFLCTALLLAMIRDSQLVVSGCYSLTYIYLNGQSQDATESIAAAKADASAAKADASTFGRELEEAKRQLKEAADISAAQASGES